MTHFCLTLAGYDRLEGIIKKLEAAADRGIANPDEAGARLGDVRACLYQLRQLVYTGDAITAAGPTRREPLGPGAA